VTIIVMIFCGLMLVATMHLLGMTHGSSNNSSQFGRIGLIR
jgi:hypothetical protein